MLHHSLSKSMSENSLRDKHAPVCTTSFNRKSAFMSPTRPAAAAAAAGRRNSLKQGREQRMAERAQKKKLPNGFALEINEAAKNQGRARRISQLPSATEACLCHLIASTDNMDRCDSCMLLLYWLAVVRNIS